ncbi:MAG: hypothetical protein G01um10147_1096 [Microgenomates group bacterium Gr01-1014_7]|nr:MAG: hypothetical protein G01um10147_1096 [Microgenomates group bacterium Gr01-1014_7]
MSLLEQVEQAYYHALGIRKEFPELNPIACGLMVAGSLLHAGKHHSIIKGHLLPASGAAILTGNHYQEGDIYEACLAARKAGRLVRTIVKKSLVVEGDYESEEYLRNIGDKKNPLDYSPMKAFVMKGVGVIPIPRDNPGRGFATHCLRIMDSGQLLGIFLQPSRDEEGLLRNLQGGVALFASAKKYRDVPVYPIAFSDDRAIVLEPFTYNQIRDQDYGRDITVAEFTIYIADRIAAALPKKVQDDWKTRRDKEFLRLSTSS